MEFQFEQMRAREDMWWRAIGLPYDVWVRAGKRPDGRLKCTELLVTAPRGHELLARQVQKIPVGAIMDALTKKALDMRRRNVKVSPPTQRELERLWPSLPARTPTPRRTATSEELIREIAAEYQRLVNTGEPHAVKRLAKKHIWKANGRSVTYSAENIRRILREARPPKRDLLGPSIRGKAGERPKKKGKK